MNAYVSLAAENEMVFNEPNSLGGHVADQNDKIDKLRNALHRLHDWARASPDWRPDTKLARDVTQALDR